MYSCKDASRMASDAMDRPLRPMEWINLRMHLLFCATCRRFVQNIHLLDGVLNNMLPQHDAVTLNEHDRQTIKDHIKNRIDQ